MGETLHWLDVQDLAEELDEAHPDIDPLTVRFTRLRELVEALPDFTAQEGHPCNERILETIQAYWVEVRTEGEIDEDRDVAPPAV